MVADGFLLSVERDPVHSIAWADPPAHIAVHAQLFFNTGRFLFSSGRNGRDRAILDTKATGYALARINPMHESPPSSYTRPQPLPLAVFTKSPNGGADYLA